VGLNSLKSLNLTNVYPNNNKNKKKKNNKVKSKPLELFELAGKNWKRHYSQFSSSRSSGLGYLMECYKSLLIYFLPASKVFTHSTHIMLRNLLTQSACNIFWLLILDTPGLRACRFRKYQIKNRSNFFQNVIKNS
jgi:hypothetical protein